MSQPVGIIAKINISEDSYKKYVRQVAADVLAGNVFDCIRGKNRDLYVFHYLKKENALYAFCFFNYGNSTFLLEHPILDMFKKITPYLDDDSKGYLIATCDSLNNTPEDFVYVACIENRKWKEQPLSVAQQEAYWKDADKYFFKKAEAGMEIVMPRVLDKGVIKKVKALGEKYRVQHLKDNLHTATIEKPLELFGGYFYNGRQFYCCMPGQDVVIFDHINLQELRQEPYGVRDNNGVIVGQTYLATDPAKFKVWHKNDTTFYSSAEAVYDYKLNPYPSSDGLSYKMISDYIGEDKAYIYFTGEQLLKSEIGAYAINSSGYFFQNVLLYNKSQVRAGAIVLQNIDAASFEILSPDALVFCKEHGLENPSGSYAGCFILHCRDKDGELIIHNYDIHKTSITVERITSLGDYVADTKVLLQDIGAQRLKNYYPQYKEGKESIYYEAMNSWLADGFEDKWQTGQYNGSFLIAMNNYFYCCFQLYLQDKDTTYLQAGVSLFEKISATCFINPAVFHNTACIYAALCNAEKALQSISAALHYGYEKISMVWEDQDLSLLFKNQDFLSLKAYYEANRNYYPFINLPVLNKITTITDTYYKNSVAASMLNRFSIPDLPSFAAELVPEAQRDYYAEMKEKIAYFLNAALQQQSLYYKDNYARYKDYAFLNVRTHFFALQGFFNEAHRKYRSNDIHFCMPIAKKVKTLIAQHRGETDTEMLVQEIRGMGINKILGLVE